MRSLLVAPVTLALAAWALSATAQEVKADVQAGEKKAAMCIGCHSIPGYQASFPEVHKVPMLAGQTASYMRSALAAYKKGERKHPTMRAVAASLSEQDIADLTAFFSLEVGEGKRTGVLVEYDTTDKLFTNPGDKRTEDYVTGRFG